MSEQQKRDRLLTPFIERNLQLVGNRLPEGKNDPSLGFEFDPENNNKLTCIVWSGVPGDEGRQVPIRMHMEAYAVTALALYASRASSMAAGTESLGIKVKGLRKKAPGNENKGTNMGWDGTLFVGKDQQNVCYICVMAKGHGKLKFPFKPSNWTDMINVRTNEPATLAEVSADYSEAWANFIGPVAAALLVNHPYDWKAGREDRQSGGNGGNNNNRNNGGGGNGNRGGGDMSFLDNDKGGGNSFDDDIPM